MLYTEGASASQLGNKLLTWLAQALNKPSCPVSSANYQEPLQHSAPHGIATAPSLAPALAPRHLQSPEGEAGRPYRGEQSWGGEEASPSEPAIKPRVAEQCPGAKGPRVSAALARLLSLCCLYCWKQHANCCYPALTPHCLPLPLADCSSALLRGQDPSLWMGGTGITAICMVAPACSSVQQPQGVRRQSNHPGRSGTRQGPVQPGLVLPTITTAMII